MATKKYVKDVQKEEGKFGHYKTGTGGGEPIPAGKKMTNEKRDPAQPRDQFGHFTYNSVNGKPLKDISKVHGHSRGTTIPPTLTGGDGTIHYYSDSSHDHIVKGGQDALEKYTSLTVSEAYRKGDKLIGFDGKVAIAPKDFMESAMEYVANKGKEKDLSGALKEAAEARASGDKKALGEAIDKVLASGHYEGEPTGSWERKEVETPEEKRAFEKAKEEKTKGHELLERKREEEVAAAPKYKKMASWFSSYKPSVAPSTPTEAKEEIRESAPASATASLSDEQISKFAEKIKTPGLTRGMIEEALADPESGLSSVDDILSAIEEKPEEGKAEELTPKEADKIEEASEEATEDELVKVMQGIGKKALIDVFRSGSEEGKAAMSDILPFAKEWSKGKSEMEGKEDMELVISYINEKLGKTEDEEKEETLKEFRGE